MFTVATLATLARFLSRLPVLKGSGFGWDDYMLILAWAILFPVVIVIDNMVTQGLGQDVWMLSDPSSQISATMFWFFVAECPYILELNVTKISILLLYLRMWPESRTSSPWFRWSCFVLIAGMALFTSIAMLVMGMQCQPLEYNWLQWDGQHE
jgi:hypothetical protein